MAEAARAAMLVRHALADAGLTAGVKTSGSAGLHVHVPLGTPHDPTRVKAFARRLAASLAAAHGDLVTDDPRPVARAGRVLVDWLQSEPRRLTVAPYSLRATDRPAVSTPLSWEEVAHAPDDLSFGPAEVLTRIARYGDLFATALTTRQAVPK
jgi:bifunctional non-homologous end joining protein LigD